MAQASILAASSALAIVMSAANLIQIFSFAQNELPLFAPVASQAFAVLGAVYFLEYMSANMETASLYLIGTVSFDSLAFIMLAYAVMNGTMDLTYSSAIIAIKYTLYFSSFWSQPNTTTIASETSNDDDIESDGGIEGENDDDTSDDTSDSDDVSDGFYSKKVNDEIRDMGGTLPWLRGFSIFCTWIWPTGQLRLQLGVTFTLCLAMLVEPGFDVLVPQIEAAGVQSIAEALVSKSMEHVWRPMGAVIITSILNSSSGLRTLRKVIWSDYEFWRRRTMNQATYKHILNLDASYHDSVDPDITASVVAMGSHVDAMFDRLVFELMPSLVQLCIAAWTVSSLYGSLVVLVQICAAAIYGLISLRKARSDISILEQDSDSHRRLDRIWWNGVDGWRNTAQHNQINAGIDSFEEEWHLRSQKRHLVQSVGRKFDAAFNTIDHVAYFSAMALAGWNFIQGGQDMKIIHSFQANYLLMFNPMGELAELPSTIMKDFHSLARLRRLMEKQSTVKNKNTNLSITKGKIEFDAVSFDYSGHKTFEDLHLAIQPGTRAALVGPTGVGKSTMTDLIMKLYEPSRGRILIDGQDVSDVSNETLRKQIAIMPQQNYIFRGTVMQNVKFCRKDATDDEARTACKMAGIHEEIMKRKKGYESVIGNYTSQFSGGERQRLHLARLFLQRHTAKILVLDEPTSALDKKTALFVRENIKKHFSEVTTIIITHQLFLIEDADQIIVLEKTDRGAKIAEIGRHQELLGSRGVYAALLNQQKEDKFEADPTVQRAD